MRLTFLDTPLPGKHLREIPSGSVVRRVSTTEKRNAIHYVVTGTYTAEGTSRTIVALSSGLSISANSEEVCIIEDATLTIGADIP